MMHKTGGIIGASLMIGTALFAGNIAHAASATASYTAPQKTNIRTGQGTNTALFGTVPAGTKITGVLQPSGWVKISTPSADAGRYVSSSVLSPTAVSSTSTTPNVVTAWAGYTKTSLYSAPSYSSSVGQIPTSTKVTGTMTNGGAWFRIASGPYAGRYMDGDSLFFHEPGTTYGSAGSARTVPDGQTVTRYTISDLYQSAVRSAPTTHSTLMARVNTGTALTGQYINKGSWFKITSGSYAGRYIAADRIYTTKSESAYNGNMPKASLCELPSNFNSAWAPTTNRALQCDAAHSLEEMNTAFKARFGHDIQLNEGYRDLFTQQMYLKIFGSRTAAIPGTSNHGLGNAIDLEGVTSAQKAGRSSSYYSYGSAADQWLTQNGLNYGWDRPAFMDKGGSNEEYWHYNYVG